MPDRRSSAAADLPVDDVIDIQGDVPPADQDGVLDPDELEHERVPSRTEVDHGAPMPDPVATDGDVAALDGLDLDGLREGETDDPIAATEEGLAYVPPIDPPVVADDDHRSIDLDPESDRNARIHAALRADAATAHIEPFLIIGSMGGRVVVRGIVDDVDEADAVAAVIERLPGVTEVVDETELTDETRLPS